MAGKLYVTDGRIMLFNTLEASGYEFRETGLPAGYICTDLAADYTDPDKMYAIIYTAAAGYVLYRSTDAGQNWSSCLDKDGRVRWICANPTIAGEVWAAVSEDGADADDYGMWKSTDYGVNWTKKYYRAGYAIAVFCYGLTSVWAFHTNPNPSWPMLNVSADGGDTWSAAKEAGWGGVAGVMTMAAMTSGHGMYMGSNFGPAITTDNWDSYTDRDAEADGRAVSFNNDASYLLGSMFNDPDWELKKSSDDGATWAVKLTNAYLQAMTKQLVTFMPGTNKVFHGGTSGYIIYSLDAGENWSSFQCDRNTTIRAILGTADPVSAFFACKLVIA